ncbi:hypothetical protein Nepgr_008827 [Nepenthes gracilis]|uniref:Uncharacterized protein n=1 Tax=Nepenthes gracilis TaxID=150966 RepID=A0AAD3XJL3_NEPGR|nr:hypothetical protein Nepgr_008827 [Nepenthes gracilis]
MSTTTMLSRFSSIRFKTKSIAIVPNLLKPGCQSQACSSPTCIFRFSRRRLAAEISCLITMMPLHSAVASSRLLSNLSIDSRNWSLIPQGISMPL